MITPVTSSTTPTTLPIEVEKNPFVAEPIEPNSDTGKIEAYKEEEKQKQHLQIKNLYKLCLDKIENASSQKESYTVSQLLLERFVALFRTVEDKQLEHYHVLFKIIEELSQPEKPLELTAKEAALFGEEAKLYHILMKEKKFYSLKVQEFTKNAVTEKNPQISLSLVKGLYHVYKEHLLAAFDYNLFLLKELEDEFKTLNPNTKLKKKDRESTLLTTLLQSYMGGVTKQIQFYTRDFQKKQELIERVFTQMGDHQGAIPERLNYLEHLLQSTHNSTARLLSRLNANMERITPPFTQLKEHHASKLSSSKNYDTFKHIAQKIDTAYEELEQILGKCDNPSELKNHLINKAPTISTALDFLENNPTDVIHGMEMGNVSTVLESIDLLLKESNEQIQINAALYSFIENEIKKVPEMKREDRDMWLALIDAFDDEPAPVTAIKTEPTKITAHPVLKESKVEEVFTPSITPSPKQILDLTPDTYGLRLMQFAIAIEEHILSSPTDKAVHLARGDALDHLFLAASGLNKLFSVIKKGDLAPLALIVPMLIRDWHTAIEQMLACDLIAKHKTRPISHHLKELTGDWDTLDSTMKKHLEQLDFALIWSRYPYNSAAHHKELPEMLKIILSCIEISKGGSFDPKLFDKLIEMHLKTQAFIISTHPDTELKALHQQFMDAPKPQYQLGAGKAAPKKPHESLVNIEKVLATFQSTMKQTAAMQEAEGHLIRFHQGLRLFLEESDLNKNLHLHHHYILDLQWLFESLYQSLMEERQMGKIQTHDLNLIYQTLMTEKREFDAFIKDNKIPPLPNVLESLNLGKGGHYSRQIFAQTERPMLKQYIASLNLGKKFAYCEDDFAPAGGVKDGKISAKMINTLIRDSLTQLQSTIT